MVSRGTDDPALTPRVAPTLRDFTIAEHAAPDQPDSVSASFFTFGLNSVLGQPLKEIAPSCGSLPRASAPMAANNALKDGATPTISLSTLRNDKDRMCKQSPSNLPRLAYDQSPTTGLGELARATTYEGKPFCVLMQKSMADDQKSHQSVLCVLEMCVTDQEYDAPILNGLAGCIKKNIQCADKVDLCAPLSTSISDSKRICVILRSVVADDLDIWNSPPAFFSSANFIFLQCVAATAYNASGPAPTKPSFPFYMPFDPGILIFLDDITSILPIYFHSAQLAKSMLVITVPCYIRNASASISILRGSNYADIQDRQIQLYIDSKILIEPE